ncbi:shikimate kinase [Psychrobacter sp. AOP22-C1-C5]|uniref:shikimate kinase n=1 Tax=Psychrobacter sp. AOP22-C1-C5 TaxID=3457716 RepID=UPI004036F82B
MKKINVVGTSGSGKSTFSRMLAKKLDYPYLEMDAMFWRANWQESSDEEFFAKLQQYLSQDRWVLDGNYHRTVDIKWADVDHVIWIDYPFSRTIYQAVKRVFIRSLTKTELWDDTGNIETFRKSFLSRDSVILWTLKTYNRNRVRYIEMFNDPKYSHIEFVRLKNPKMAKTYIDELPI